MEDSIKNSVDRIAHFTSSEIVALVKCGTRLMTADELALRPKTGKGSKTTLIEDSNIMGDAALTYIKQKNREMRLHRSLDNDSSAKPLTWGKLGEDYVFKHLLDTSYTYLFEKVYVNPEIPTHSGSPDALKEVENRVVEVKCPLTLNSYCDFADCNTIEEVRENHKDGEKYYQQIVSNSILTNTINAELIIFVPTKKDIVVMKEMVNDWDDPDYQKKLSWVFFADDDELPWIPENGYYKNLIRFNFEVPQADKDLLIDRIKLASELLIKR